LTINKRALRKTKSYEDRVIAEVNSVLMLDTKTRIGTAVRCSIILPAGNDPAKLNAYLLYLSEARLPSGYELVVINDRELEIDERQLKASLPTLKVLNVGGGLSQEQLFDRGAMAARGRFLLFVRGLVNFDKLVLEESIKELETSEEKVSISANKNFVLVERLHYASWGGFEEQFGAVGSKRDEPELKSSGEINYFRNLCNESIPFKCGPGTFVDPDVIIDSAKSVEIGANCTIRKGVVLRPEGGEIVIGDNCVIDHYCVFHGKGGIYFGDWVVVAPHCGFYAQNHTYESFDTPIVKQPDAGKGIYLMGDNAIGSHSVICDDVTIGKGTIVKANSTVTESMPMASIAAGSPAQVIEKRYSGRWEFHKVERASFEGMPEEICEHVRKRGMLIRELIDVRDRILDVGCGEGIITAIIAEKSQSVVGCDYSTEAIEIAREQHPHIEFVHSNSTNLRFNNESFTKVTMSDVAEHLIPVQFLNTLEEVNRVLKKGGEVILATPVTGKGKNVSTYAHVYEYSEHEIEQILSKVFCNIKFINSQFGIFMAQKR